MTNTENQKDDAAVHDRPSYDDVNTSAIVMMGIISAIITVVIVAFVQGLSYHWQRLSAESMAEKYNTNWAVTEQIAEQRENLNNAKTPIAEAMKNVVSEFGGTSSHGETEKPAENDGGNEGH
ncbi:MAG: hypothetical protein R3C03_17925 [Pirellulaceae bacterium]